MEIALLVALAEKRQNSCPIETEAMLIASSQRAVQWLGVERAAVDKLLGLDCPARELARHQLSQRLREQRQSIGLRQWEVAKRIGRGQRYVANCENSDIPKSLDVETISDALEFSDGERAEIRTLFDKVWQ